jgi:hypothetical protein
VRSDTQTYVFKSDVSAAALTLEQGHIALERLP